MNNIRQSCCEGADEEGPAVIDLVMRRVHCEATLRAFKTNISVAQTLQGKQTI